MSEIGPQKRILREKAQIGVRALARAMGISAPYLIDLERGHRRFTEELQALHDDALATLTNKKPNAGMARR